MTDTSDHPRVVALKRKHREQLDALRSRLGTDSNVVARQEAIRTLREKQDKELHMALESVRRETFERMRKGLVRGLNVVCPRCGSGVLDDCRTPNGAKSYRSHDARLYASGVKK